MANREACELYIEQEIDSGLDAGKTPHSIGKELSDWVVKMFEVRINPNTLKTRAYRRKHKDDSNESSPEVNSPKKPVTDPVVDQSKGQKIKKKVPDDRRVNDNVKEAMDAMAEEIMTTRRDWGTASKEYVLGNLNALKNIVAPPKKPTKRQIALQEGFWNADHVISERAAFHIKNSNIGDQMRNGDKISTVERIIDIEGSRSVLSVRVVVEKR